MMRLYKRNRFFYLLLVIALIVSNATGIALGQSPLTVSGKVTGGGGEGLPGVSVAVKGTTQGTVTNSDGNFSLQVPDANSTLVFSYIGYTSREVAVNGAANLNVTLSEDAKALEEVVVIGYGEKDRRMLTESIGTVTSEEVQRIPVASPDQALQGRVSGVQVTSVDGTPGSPVSVRIRGVSTVGNNQPLYVIDGIPVGTGGGGVTNPLATINPADIESMSVLKDASAAAVYGVRAANGVVLITTKRGKTGKPTVRYDGYYGVQNFPKLYDWNNSEQYVQLATEAINNRNAQNGDDAIVLHPDLQPGSPLLNVNTDWQDAVLNKDAPIQNHNLSVSGGSEAASFHVSAGYFNQEATIRKWDLERFNFRVNGDFKIGNRFTIGQNFAIAYQEIQRGMNAGGDGFLYGSTANQPPFFRIFEDPANPIPGNRYGYTGNYNVGGLTIANQVGINEILEVIDRRTNVLGGIHGTLEVLPDLKFRTAASIDFNTSRNTNWQPGYTNEELGLARNINNYNDSRGEGYTQVFTNTLTYDKALGDHSINALAGIEYQKLRSTGLSYRGENYLSTAPAFYQNISNQGGDADGNFANAGSSNFNQAFVGYIGRLSYDYKQKYLLTATVRRDGVATFPPENRWGTFPSVSAAWRISQEPFMAKLTLINDLKIRGSWGQLGNSNTAQFPHVFRVSFTPDYALGGVTQQAPVQVNLPNQDVTWETVQTTDFGFDMYMFNNRFNLLATYYIRETKDFLYNLPIPAVGGFTSIPVNLGTVENRGIEVEMGYNGKIGNAVEFNVSGNITTIRNRLTALAPGIQEFSSGDYRTAVGYPIGYFYGYKTGGIYQTQAEADGALPDNLARDVNKPRPGDVIFLDVNGPAPEDAPRGVQFSGEPDGIITPADRTYLGKTIPDFFYGMNMGFNAYGFDLNVLFQGVSGVQLYNSYRRSNIGLGGPGRNQLVESQERWTGPNTSNSMPRAVAGDPAQNNRFSDRFVEDAGFLRLRNIQLGYTVPASFVERTRAFSTARVYIAANNLFTITDYSGLDPEVVTFGQNTSATSAGTDNANIPQPRIFQGGIQLSF
ncbi:TonB-dependent receptor [Pontibacter diazotrophicus]|uniref:TonB-dependent receptor n=1 Tax=Pontibacter diazotrophicus TaxID=1400979 RepID=A0A3D8LCB7_9BACT|nr:TonB-dependent receptor [Pontibacter diazotrophicus]RDV15040.1 TonB-dependent receptor [Pontibacter diazotrophicus]